MDGDAHQIAELRRKLQAETRKLDAVREIARALVATLDLDDLLGVLLDRLAALLDAERATLFLLDETGQELVSALSFGGLGDPIRLKVGEGIAGWVARTGDTVNLTDAYADPRFMPAVDQRTGFRTRSLICAPMPDHRGRTIGVVQVLNRRARPFDADDEALLQAVAAHAAASIENSKLYRSVLTKNKELLEAQRALEQRAFELDLLYQMEREAATTEDVDQLVDRLLQRAMRLLDVEAGSVLLRDQSSGQLYFGKARGSAGATRLAEIVRKPLSGAGGIIGWVARQGRVALVPDARVDERHDRALAEQLGLPARSIVCVPLFAVAAAGESEALGAVELINPCGRAAFDDNDLKLLTLVAGQMAKTISAARHEEASRSERLASIGQMLSGVVHDLKTPMTVASGYVQLLQQSDDAAQRERYGATVLKQLDLMAAMTNEVLKFARGDSSLLVRKVYVKRFVAELTEQLERALEGRNVRLIVSSTYDGVAWFDEIKMLRLAHNLARNAADAMEGGGVFEVQIDAQDGDLHLSFRDTGRGLPPEMTGRVFQAFASAGKAGGTGLGLAIVKKIVDEHHGTISYDSGAGGTTFHMRIPLLRASVETAGAA